MSTNYARFWFHETSVSRFLKPVTQKEFNQRAVLLSAFDTVYSSFLALSVRVWVFNTNNLLKLRCRKLIFHFTSTTVRSSKYKCDYLKCIFFFKNNFIHDPAYLHYFGVFTYNKISNTSSRQYCCSINEFMPWPRGHGQNENSTLN